MQLKVSNLGGGGIRGRKALSTSETFCTECQRVTYISEGARLECPVCSSPLLATIDDDGSSERVEDLPATG